MSRSVLFLAIVSLTWGCSYGMNATKFRPAQGPEGVRGEITTGAQHFLGELIDVPDDGVVFLAENAAAVSGKILRLLPYTSILTSRFDQISGRFAIAGGRTPDAEARERLRLLSRYPHGLTQELLSPLLRAYGQAALAGVER